MCTITRYNNGDTTIFVGTSTELDGSRPMNTIARFEPITQQYLKWYAQKVLESKFAFDEMSIEDRAFASNQSQNRRIDEKEPLYAYFEQVTLASDFHQLKNKSRSG